MLEVWSFSGADCDTDHYVVITKVGGRLMVNKQAAQKSDGVGFNLEKFRVLLIKKQYQIKISNRFAPLENLYDSKHIKGAWENNRKTIKISVKENLGLQEWKQHKPRFDKKFSQFLDPRKQAKMHWLHDPNQR